MKYIKANHIKLACLIFAAFNNFQMQIDENEYLDIIAFLIKKIETR